MIRRPPRSTRTDTPFPTRRSSDLCTTDDPRPPLHGATWGYCVLDNDYKASQFPAHTPIENMKVTGAHERSEEHTSELQSLMRISYAVFCLKKKKNLITNNHTKTRNITNKRTLDQNTITQIN